MALPLSPPFLGPGPFDREVFLRIGDYLGMPLRRPVVFLDRERVVRRHLHAFLPGSSSGAYTFQGNMLGRWTPTEEWVGSAANREPADGNVEVLNRQLMDRTAASAEWSICGLPRISGKWR